MGIKVNEFAETRFILEANFGGDPLERSILMNSVNRVLIKIGKNRKWYNTIIHDRSRIMLLTILINKYGNNDNLIMNNLLWYIVYFQE